MQGWWQWKYTETESDHGIVLTINSEVDSWMGKPCEVRGIIDKHYTNQSDKKRNSNKYKKNWKLKVK